MFGRIKRLIEQLKCDHDWELVREYETAVYNEPFQKRPDYYRLDQEWECTKCGKYIETSKII